MSAFIQHLHRERELIHQGLELLEVYLTDLEIGKSIAAGDLRMAAYAMQIAFETSHLVKQESILFPALTHSKGWLELTDETRLRLVALMRGSPPHDQIRTCLLQLRLAIDDFESAPDRRGTVVRRLGEFNGLLGSYMKREETELFEIADQILSSNDQTDLPLTAEMSELSQGLDHLQGPRTIFRRLRLARGIDAA